ncbi:putative ribonuclease H-like domain-containing protein [Tanacetum coccineum]
MDCLRYARCIDLLIDVENTHIWCTKDLGLSLSEELWNVDISSGDETLTNFLHMKTSKEKMAYKARLSDSDDEETDVFRDVQKENCFNAENCEESFEKQKGSTVGSQSSYFPQTVKKSANAKSKTNMENQKGYIIDSVKLGNGSLHSQAFEYVTPLEGQSEKRISRTMLLDSGMLGSLTGDKEKKGKQHRAFARKIEEKNCQEKPLELLHMDLFGTCFRPNPGESVWIVEERVKGETSKVKTIDLLLPIQFWAEAVNTACYVLNRVLVTKPQMKTPYEILMGRSPNISFMRPFGCPLTILNTLDHLGKFDGKSEEGYLLGYSTNSKGFRVYNRVTRKVQDCLHVNFLENQENQKGKGPDWMFDLELLTPSMNYIPVRKENYADSGGNVSTHDDVDDLDDQQFIVHGPNIHAAQNKPSEERTADKEVPLSSDEQALHDELVSLMHQESLAKLHNDAQRTAFEKEKKRIALEKGKECVDSTFTLSTANTPPQSTGNTPTDSDDDIPKDGVFSTNSFDAENTDTEEGGAADYNNMDPTIDVTSTPTLRIHKIHPQSQIIGKSTAGVQTRRKLKDSTSNQHQALLSFIYKQNRTNHKDQQTCLFACFLSQEEPKKVSQALADESWVEAMQEELLQFKLQEVWVLCDLPEGKRVIGTKWVFRNKRDERGTIIKNKARLVAQGYRQEEGVDYDEVVCTCC